MQLHREEARWTQAGARLVVIGNGPPWSIKGFREKSGYDGALYTDPDRACYRSLELRRDLRTTFSLATVRSALRAYRQGFRQTSLHGDPWQQGGVFVIQQDGTIIYSQVSEHAGDHPSIAAIRAALSG